MGTFLKIVVFFLTIIIIVIFSGYYAFFHSSLPAKAVFALIEKGDKHWEFDDISGSISTGFSIGKLKYRDQDNPALENRVYNVGFEYKNSEDAVTITKINLDSARLYIDFTSDEFKTEIREESIENDDPGRENNSETDKEFETIDDDSFFEEYSNKDWVIEEISLNNLVVKDPVNGHQFNLKKVLSEGFMISDKKAFFGKLEIESENLELALVPVGNLNDKNMSQEADINGIVKNGFFGKVLRDFDFKGSFSSKDRTFGINSFSAFAGKIRIDKRFGDSQRLEADNFSPFDYLVIDEFPPVKEINFKGKNVFRGEKRTAIEIESGDFKLGNVKFDLDKGSIRFDKDGKSDDFITAKAEYNGLDYQVKITSKDGLKFEFSSESAKSNEEILARIMFGKDFSMLSDEQQENLKKM